MSLSYSLSSSRMSGLSAGAGGGARVGYGGAGAGLGLGLRLGSGAAAGAGAGAGLGLGLGLGLGQGAGLGLGSGFGLGSGIGAGLGLGIGGAGLALGSGGGVGVIVPSPAFAMGRTIAAGGLTAGSALAGGPALGPTVAPILSRAAEKTTLSTLNDRFSGYMTKVRALQQENAALEAKLSQLTGGTDVSPESSSTTSVEYETQLNEYRNTLQNLTLDTIKLAIELDNVRGTAHELKAKLDFEQGVRFQLESDIAAMKKDVEGASDLRTDLDAQLSSLKNELDFVSKTQESELSSLQSKLGTTTMDTSVSMIEVDTGKSFDISSALNKMRAEYEKSVQQHRDEAEAYYKLKMDEIQTANAKSTEAVSSTKSETAAARKELQALGLELQGLITQNAALEQSLAEANAQSSVGVAEYQAQIASLTSAIESAKADLHKQILAYQELLDVKLALDVEIATYRKLLEGDDFKLPDFTESSYSFSGYAPPKTSTPQDSPHHTTEIHTRYVHQAGGGGIQIKRIITDHTETSVISDADTESS